MPELGSARKIANVKKRAQEDTKGQDVAQRPISYLEDAAKLDRIKKWQSHNLAEAIDPDVLSVRSQPWSEAFCTPLPPQSPDPLRAQDKEPASTPRRRSTKWVQQDNKTWVKQRRSVKGEQRKNSSNDVAQMQAFERARTPPRAESPSTEFVRTTSQRTRNVNSSRAEREERRRRRRRDARARAGGGDTLVEDGIRVYMRSESRLVSEADEVETTRAPSFKDDADQRTPEYKSQLSFKHDGSLPSDHDDVEENVQSQPSKYAQTLGQPPEYDGGSQQQKTKKRAILTKTKGIFSGKHDLPETPSNRIPSIQAWLEEQPDVSDPFIDKGQETLPQTETLPKPLKHRSHRKKVAIEPTVVEVGDPNQMWDSIMPKQDNGKRKGSKSTQKNAPCPASETSPPKRRLFSFEVCDEASKGEELTPQPPEYTEHSFLPSKLDRKDAKPSRRNRESVQEPSRPLEGESTNLTRENSIQPDRDISPTNNSPAVPQRSSQSISTNTPIGDHDAIHVEQQPSAALKRKLTTHEDLLSVLSRSYTRKSIRSNRKPDQIHAASADTIIREALQSMQEEEAKYARELRTLVDGVTPVLLQSLLSKEDAAATAGLFSGNNKSTSFTRPIIDMGVALQRLKQLHLRIPLQDQNIEALLTWAVTAHKSYSDYVKSWRLGFQGVVVNLAPLHESQLTEEDMLARDIDGDVTDGQGQKVDVAYLQKRPLVRLKRLSKLFSIIRDSMPDHEAGKRVADMYADLTETAKQRHSEEQGRLEDEAAATIDATRVRDLKSMAPLESAEVNKTRRVRARDFFDMSICHSTGQRLDCKVELVLRDDPEPSHVGGDVLICQVEEERKWLLFQPILLTNLSSRRDQSSCDLVLMVKGVAGIGTSWMELAALRAEDPAAVTEWLHMLGSNPLPPRLNHIPSWHLPSEPQAVPQPVQEGLRVPLSAAALANLPSDVDVPIGEPSIISGRNRSHVERRSRPSEAKPLPKPPQLSLGGGLQNKSLPQRYHDTAGSLPQQFPPSAPQPEQPPSTRKTAQIPNKPSKPSNVVHSVTPAQESPSQNSVHEPLFPRQRYAPQNFSQPSNLSGVSSNTYFTQSDTTSRHPSEVQSDARAQVREFKDTRRVEKMEPLMSGALNPECSDTTLSQEFPTATESSLTDLTLQEQSPSPRPRRHSRAKSSSVPLTDTIREQWAAFSGLRKKTQSSPSTPEKKLLVSQPELSNVQPPQQALQNDTSTSMDTPGEPPTTPSSSPPPPPPPQHRASYTISSSLQKVPISTPPIPQFSTQTYKDVTSPLKHEYQPSSSASDSGSESDETEATSEMSEDDFRSELKDEPTPLVSVNQGQRKPSFGPSRPLPSVPSTGTRTLAPSDSASNGPYRRAPPPSSFPAHKKKRTIALVCSWSERGIWEPIRDEECSIVISPGLVQAFPMTAAHSQPMAGADWEDEPEPTHEQQSPIVEFELTPVVPLRKGTALDITIRSPPTPNSMVRTTNNVMFRSRTVQECEKLYQLINWARCNNPTYAQLARSRAHEQPVTFATNVAQSKSRSWFSFGSREKKSYRATSRPPTSVADSFATTNSTSSAFAALKKFGQNSPFSLNRSSVIRRPGFSGTGGSLYSSSNTGSGSGTSTPAPSQSGFIPGPEGPNVPQTSAEAANGGGMVNNMKIRLFLRQGQKWEALGQSLLTVLPAAISTESKLDNAGDVTPPDRSRPPSAMPKPRGRHFRLPSSDSTPHRIHGDGREKRLLITAAKSKDVVLLDEILGESCFEKVMQTGIAVNVWREDNEVQEYGGVMTGRSRTYMIQFRTSTEASWVFNMCGTYRYGSGAAG